MAKKINKSDLFGDDLFGSVNKDATLLLKNIDGILLATKENLRVSKEYLLTWKSINSQSIKDLNATMAQSGKMIQINNGLTKEQLKIEQQLQKTLEQTNKTKISANRLSEQNAKLAAKEAKERSALNSIYSQESKRLNDLRNSYKNLALAEGESSRGAKNMLKEITALDNKLKKLDNTVGQNQRNVGNYSGALKGFGNAVLGVAGISLGAAQVGSFIREASEDFKEFDKQLKEVQAITGLAGKDLEFFGEKAKEAGKTTTTSASDYLNAIKLIGSARPELLKNKEALAEVTDQALILSQASGLELPVAASALTSALNQFNLSGDESARVINALAAASKEGAVEVPELDEAMKNVGTVAAGANLSLEETVAILEVLGEKGLKGAEGGTKARGAILQLQKAGLGFASGQFKMNDALKDAEKLLNSIKDPAERAKKEIHLFGAENITAGKILVANKEKTQALTKAITGTSVATQQAGINNESAAAKSTILTNKLQTLRIELGERLLPVMNFFKESAIAILTPIQDLIPVLQELAAITKENEGRFNGFGDSLLALNSDGTLRDVTDGISGLANAYKALEGRSAETQQKGKELLKQFQDGTITIQKFGQEAAKLFQNERQSSIRKIQAAGISINGLSKSGTGGGPTEEEIAKAKEARAKAYQAELKNLELRKTNAEIFIKSTIDNEEEKNLRLSELNVEYLGQKSVIEKKYDEEYRKTILERVNAELAEEKRLLDISIQKENEYEKRLSDYKQFQKDLIAISEKSIEEQDELEAEQAANKIAYEEYAEKKNAEKKEKERQENVELFDRFIDNIEKEVERENQIKEDAIDKRIDSREKEIDRQLELAANGRANQLDFERKQLAEDQLAKRQLQEKEIRQQRLIAFWKSYAAYASEDPQQALLKATRDLALSTIVTAAFWDGTEKVSEDSQFNKNKAHNGRDGYVANFDGSERILPGSLNDKLGGMSNDELVERALLPSYIVNQPNKLTSVNDSAIISQGLKDVRNELHNVKKAIENKPENYANLTKLGEVIETRVHNGLTKIIRHVNKKSRL